MGNRPFNPQKDIRTLQAFLAQMRGQVGQATYFQFGDLIWRIHYYKNGFNAAKDLRIWHDDDGCIEGFTHYQTQDNNPELFLRPEHYATPLADEMLAWCIERAKADDATTIVTSCIDRDSYKRSYLSQNGFQQLDDTMVFMERRLDGDIPEAELPPEYTIVSQTKRPDLASTTGSKWSAAEYAKIYNARGYKDALGLRVCYQGNEIVAGGICWHDDLDSCGELEPVGTNEEHRGKGLAFAVLSRILRNLKAYGAETAYVRTDKDNVPAVRLYQKLGFRIIDEDYGWELAI